MNRVQLLFRKQYNSIAKVFFKRHWKKLADVLHYILIFTSGSLYSYLHIHFRKKEKGSAMSDFVKPNWKVNLVMLWFSQLLVMAGFSAMIPFIPLFIKEELHIANEGALAIYVSMFNFFGTLAYALFCPVWGKLADRFGVKPMLLRGTFLTAFLFPLMGYVSSVGWLIFLRFLSAACAGTTAASQTMIARNTPDDRQGFAQGVLTTAIWGGAMLGNVIGGLIIYYFDYLYAFWFCGILYFVAGFSILFTHDEFVPILHHAAARHSSHRREKDGPQLLLPAFTKAVWLLFGLFLLTGIIRQYENPYIALKIEALCGKETASYWTGIVSAAVCCGAIFAGVIGGYLSDKLPPKKLLLPIMLISGAALALQGFAGSLLAFAAARTVLYMAAGGIQPILQKILTSVTPRRKRGAVFGFSTTAMNSGVMLAAVFSGWTVFAMGLNSVFYVGGLLFIAVIPVFMNFLSVAMNQKYYLAQIAKNENRH